MVTNISINQAQILMFLFGTLAGSIVIGALIGAIPAIVGVIKRQYGFAVSSFFVSIIASLVYGIILSVMSSIIFLFFIYKKNNNRTMNSK
jgi:hypothetical protein